MILPAFNEEISIGSIVLLARQYVDRVIVVDDGSSDRTAEVARKVDAEVIVHSSNMGKGMALKTGFEASKGSDVIVTMDSDGQHDTSDIPKLVAPILEGVADMVNGSRYLNSHGTDTPAYQRIGQAILDKVTILNSGLKITDSQSGFRAFAGYTKDIFRFNAQGMAIESEMLADAGKSGLRIKEVEIGVRYDVNCSTINPIKHGLGVFVRILKDIRSNKPLYCFTLPGIFLGIIGLFIGTYFLQNLSIGKDLYLGPIILTVLLIFVGIFMTLIGAILQSVSTIIKDTKSI